jgi:hypothetical protein
VGATLCNVTWVRSLVGATLCNVTWVRSLVGATLCNVTWVHLDWLLHFVSLTNVMHAKLLNGVVVPDSCRSCDQPRGLAVRVSDY